LSALKFLIMYDVISNTLSSSSIYMVRNCQIDLLPLLKGIFIYHLFVSSLYNLSAFPTEILSSFSFHCLGNMRVPSSQYTLPSFLSSF
jgi:hypothetical protein